MKVVKMPLEEAVIKAAEQNFRVDVKRGLEKESEWGNLQDLYKEEARYLLVTTGENYLPENGETEHIISGLRN